ncbi:MerR family transcriptional regulator [Streptomyces sp. NPDC060232]|uniref:MerR family transcriptional regulator n=1 Tax=Streptomyces sp. NPDC060232 TaxID=3347079 RepID=UPI003663FF85
MGERDHEGGELGDAQAAGSGELDDRRHAGLLPADRTPSGYRMYDEDAVERLASISSAKLLGLALEEIRELLDVGEEGVCASVRARMVANGGARRHALEVCGAPISLVKGNGAALDRTARQHGGVLIFCGMT